MSTGWAPVGGQAVVVVGGWVVGLVVRVPVAWWVQGVSVVGRLWMLMVGGCWSCGGVMVMWSWVGWWVRVRGGGGGGGGGGGEGWGVGGGGGGGGGGGWGGGGGGGGMVVGMPWVWAV